MFFSLRADSGKHTPNKNPDMEDTDNHGQFQQLPVELERCILDKLQGMDRQLVRQVCKRWCRWLTRDNMMFWKAQTFLSNSSARATLVIGPNQKTTLRMIQYMRQHGPESVANSERVYFFSSYRDPSLADETYTRRYHVGLQSEFFYEEVQRSEADRIPSPPIIIFDLSPEDALSARGCELVRTLLSYKRRINATVFISWLISIDDVGISFRHALDAYIVCMDGSPTYTKLEFAKLLERKYFPLVDDEPCCDYPKVCQRKESVNQSFSCEDSKILFLNKCENAPFDGVAGLVMSRHVGFQNVSLMHAMQVQLGKKVYWYPRFGNSVFDKYHDVDIFIFGIYY